MALLLVQLLPLTADAKELQLEYFDPRFWTAKATGDKQRAKELSESWTRTEDNLYYGTGDLGNSLANNLSLGYWPRAKLKQPAFVRGQWIGDMTSLLIGSGIAAGGQTISAGGHFMTVTTVGTTAPVSLPVTFVGDLNKISSYSGP